MGHAQPSSWAEPVPTITAVGAQIEPGPTLAAPVPQRSRTRKVLWTIGIIFGVSLYALIKIAPWSERRSGLRFLTFEASMFCLPAHAGKVAKKPLMGRFDF